MWFLGISGSLRRGSRNGQLLREAAALAPEGVELGLHRGLEELPPYDPDLDGSEPPAAAERLREAVAGADAILIATPEYNGSIPGPLKNAVDWASRPFPENSLRNKPVAVIGATSGRFGGVWAQAELRKVLGIAGARVVDHELAIGTADRVFDSDDRLRDTEVAHQLTELLDLLTQEASEGSDPNRGTEAQGPRGIAATPHGGRRYRRGRARPVGNYERRSR